MGDGQVFPQAAHGLHLVAVHGMNHRTGTEEEQRLEESVRKEVEHGGRIALARMTAHTRHAERDHHIGYLRNGGKGQYPFDVGLRDGDDRGKKRRESTHVGYQREYIGRGEIVEREHPRDKVDARHHHRGGMDERRHRRRTLHGVRKPDVQRKHCRLAGRPHKEERHRPRCGRKAEERTARQGGHRQGSIVGRQQSEVERTRIERKDKNAD